MLPKALLVMQGMNAVVAKVDLRGMDDIINILSGRAETTVILQEVIKQYGDNPKVWMPIFNQKIKEM